MHNRYSRQAPPPAAHAAIHRESYGQQVAVDNLQQPQSLYHQQQQASSNTQARHGTNPLYGSPAFNQQDGSLQRPLRQELTHPAPSNSYMYNNYNYTVHTNDPHNNHKKEQDICSPTNLRGTTALLAFCVVGFLCQSGNNASHRIKSMLVGALIAYALDLAQARTALFVAVCLSPFVSLLVVLAGISDATDNNTFVTLTCCFLLFTNVACYATLHMEWLGTAFRARIYALLHNLLPPLAAATWTLSCGPPNLVPFCFAALLGIGMLAAENDKQRSNKDDDALKQQPNYNYSSTMAQRTHSVLLLATPCVMFLCMHGGSLWYLSPYDLILVLGVPYLIHATIVSRTNNLSFNQQQQSTIAMIVAFIVAFALVQRYLVAMSHAFAYNYVAGAKPSVVMTSFYWMLATSTSMAAGWLWGKQIEPLGDYLEDVVQLLLAIAGMALGKAFGMPWNLTPLPVLAFLGLTLWAATRMLRYLAIVLFVVHATGVVVFTYRFAGMSETLALPVPGRSVNVTLIRFSFVVVFTSVLIGLAAGLVVRSSGGFLSKFIRKFDVAGILIIIYALLLMAIEVTLIKRPVPVNELAGFEFEADDVQKNETVYRHTYALLTSAVLISISVFSLRSKILSPRAAWVVISLGIGKAVSVYIDAVIEQGRAKHQSHNGGEICVRAVVAAILFLILFCPRVFVETVHTKTVTRRRSRAAADNLPSDAIRMIFAYVFVLVPLALVLAIPYVLMPLSRVITEQMSNDYVYSSRSPILELVGTVIALWGLASLAMLNYYLPDGGGETWKKLFGLFFLAGVGVFFMAPALGTSVVDITSNPYAAMSSVGSQLINQGKYRTGGWGLLCAGFATLLVVSGPLELKERRARSPGLKDRFLLFRTMVFSILFGGGVAWFIVVQSMREADFVSLVIVLGSCLVTAFTGTISAVFSHHLELEDFNEAIQMVNIWLTEWILFVPFSWFSNFFRLESVHWFAMDGWLSTYLAVTCVTALVISWSITSRKSKNQSTRGLGNMTCLFSWFSAVVVLFGRFGVAGLGADYDVRTLLGFPASVTGTLLASPILLMLEGESQNERSASVRKLSAASTYKGERSLFTLANLRSANRWVPPLVLSVVALLMSSLYAVFLRGSGIVAIFGGPPVAMTHSELYATIFRVEEDNEAIQDVASLAQKTMAHGSALVAAAKLAGSGIWTAGSIIGPLLHIAGILATLPSLFLLIQKYWHGAKVSTLHLNFALPLTLIPIVICRGIPSLTVAGLILGLATLIQVFNLLQTTKESMMSI
jgi:hypothetical protein